MVLGRDGGGGGVKEKRRGTSRLGRSVKQEERGRKAARMIALLSSSSG